MKNNQTIIRSIGITAITGALVFGTAGLAQADDEQSSSSSESSQNSSTEFGAPIHFGGLDFGSSNSQTSDNAEATSEDDGDETSASREQSESSNVTTFGVGAISVDPSFVFEAASQAAEQAEQREDDTNDEGDDNDTSSSQSSSEQQSEVTGQAPTEFEGVEGSNSSEKSTTSESSTREDDGDETSAERTTTESSSDNQLDVGELLIDPLLGTDLSSNDSNQESASH